MPFAMEIVHSVSKQVFVIFHAPEIFDMRWAFFKSM